MKFDEAAVRMAYDAARENFLRFYSHLRAAPAELASKFHEAYLLRHHQECPIGVAE
jgi:hypothetical protein